jgi:hypothetical protein
MGFSSIYDTVSKNVKDFYMDIARILNGDFNL